MPSKRYTLQFFGADSNNNIHLLTLRPGAAKPYRVINDNPELLDYDSVVRRILKLVTNSPLSARLNTAPTPDDQVSETICILLAQTQNLIHPRFLFNVSKGVLRKTQKPPGSKKYGKNDERFNPRPVITVCPADMLTMYEEAPGLDFETEAIIKYWQDVRKNEKILYRSKLDHRVKFLDASIWHRYVCTKGAFDTNFCSILETIIHYADMYLYESLAALATLEFHCRMLQNSFIANYGERGHQEAVTPFKFHSETVMANKSRKMLEHYFFRERQGQRLADLRWDVMMVDDYSDRRIALINNRPNSPQSDPVDDAVPSKKQVIEVAIKGYSNNSKKQALHINIKAVTKGDSKIISNAIQILKEPAQTILYDIILLDYLLGASELNPNMKAYGHEFLLELITHKDRRTFRRGPMGRYWIFPISSFPFAFWDKLRQMNLDGYSEQWHISGGGDPLATPEQFRLNFMLLLSRQIAEFYQHEAALERWIDRFEMIPKKEEWTRAVRAQIFADRTKTELLAHDREHGSAFAESMEDFLNAQKDYKDFWDKLIAWLQALDNYQYGQPTEVLFQLLTEFLGGAEKESLSVCLRIENQVKKLVKDSEAELIQMVRQLAHSKDLKLIYKQESLFDFSAAIAQTHNAIELIDLSGNFLKNFNISSGHFPELRKLDLSDNHDLEYIAATELLERPKLRTLNLQNTNLAKAIAPAKAFSNTNDETRTLLRHIEQYQRSLSPAPKSSRKPRAARAAKIFIDYSPKDSAFKEMLVLHLAALRIANLVELWHDGIILPGDPHRTASLEALNQSDIYLPLISADFIAAENPLLEVVKERAKQGAFRIVPVFLRKCMLNESEFAPLQGLPSGPENPVAHWQSQDEAFYQVALGLRKLILH